MRSPTFGRAWSLLLTSALLLAGCTAGQGSTGSSTSTSPGRPTPGQTSAAPGSQSPTATSPAPTEAAAAIRTVPVAQWDRMVAAGMWRRGCPVRREQLRRVEVNYVDFSGEVRRGVLVANADVAPSLARIFTRLFDARFPIRRMQPVEAYDGDSDASLRADNTAAYNCRRHSQINAPPMKSPHAHGRAIDINPLENPWKDPRCRCWSPSARYKARRPGKGVIVKGGLVWRAFRDEGWIWQNIEVPDYMHFDTGYPSTPVRGRPDG